MSNCSLPFSFTREGQNPAGKREGGALLYINLSNSPQFPAGSHPSQFSIKKGGAIALLFLFLYQVILTQKATPVKGL
jgi:hypothetical protein